MRHPRKKKDPGPCSSLSAEKSSSCLFCLGQAVFISIKSFSLSISLSHTNSLLITCTLFHTSSLSLTCTLSLTITWTLSRTLSLPYLTHSLSITCTLFHTSSLSLSLSLTCTHFQSNTHSFTHYLSHMHTLSERVLLLRLFRSGICP